MIVRLGTVLLVMVGVVAAGVVAVSAGIVRLPLLHHSGQRSQTTTLAAQHTAANHQWASAFCTNLTEWKNAIKRDGTSLDPSLGPIARIKDATAATTQMLGRLDKLGLPPGGPDPAKPRRGKSPPLRAAITGAQTASRRKQRRDWESGRDRNPGHRPEQ